MNIQNNKIIDNTLLSIIYLYCIILLSVYNGNFEWSALGVCLILALGLDFFFHSYKIGNLINIIGIILWCIYFLILIYGILCHIFSWLPDYVHVCLERRIDYFFISVLKGLILLLIPLYTICYHKFIRIRNNRYFTKLYFLISFIILSIIFAWYYLEFNKSSRDELSKCNYIIEELEKYKKTASIYPSNACELNAYLMNTENVNNDCKYISINNSIFEYEAIDGSNNYEITINIDYRLNNYQSCLTFKTESYKYSSKKRKWRKM